MTELEEIERRAMLSTPGILRVRGADVIRHRGQDHGLDESATALGWDTVLKCENSWARRWQPGNPGPEPSPRQEQQDAMFFASARADVLALCEKVRRLEAAVAEERERARVYRFTSR